MTGTVTNMAAMECTACILMISLTPAPRKMTAEPRNGLSTAFVFTIRTKESLLTEEQYEGIISGSAEEVFWNTEDPLIRQFCVDIMTKGFAPKAIVDYERIPFVEPLTNVRVTLDLNISASKEVDRFLDLDYLKIPLQKTGEHVLEVKFDELLPGYIKQAVTVPSMVQTAFSKYYFARNLIQSTGGL